MVASVFLSKLLITFQEYQTMDLNRDMSMGHCKLLQADGVGGGTRLPLFVKTVCSCSWQYLHFIVGFTSLILSLIQSLRTQSARSPINL